MIVLKKLVEQPTWKLESMNAVDYSKIPILTITVMESLNLNSWIRGGEFLLTSTFTLPNEEELLNSLISDLKALRVSALAIKVVDEQFNIPQSVIENSEKIQFPIFFIPKKLTYLDIMGPINSQIFYEHEINVLKERIFSYLMLNENINDTVLQNTTKIINLNLMDKHVTAFSIFPYKESSYSVKEIDKIFNKFYVQCSDLQQKKAIDAFLFLRKINSIDFLLISSEEKLKGINVHQLLYDAEGRKREYENYKIGVSSIKPISKTNLAVEESILCIQLNEMIGDSNAIDFEQVKLYKLICEIYGSELENFLKDTLKSVFHNENLMRTLQVYFQKNEKLKETSQELFLHINTLHYRLNKIEMETGLRFSKMSEKVKLYLATVSYWILKTKGMRFSDELSNDK